MAQNDELLCARRRLARTVAAELVGCMAATDASALSIARRLGVSEERVWETLTGLIEGRGEITLVQLAEFAWAMGATFDVTLIPCAHPPTEEAR